MKGLGKSVQNRGHVYAMWKRSLQSEMPQYTGEMPNKLVFDGICGIKCFLEL